MPVSESPSDLDRSAPQIGSRSTIAAWSLGTALLAAGAVAVFRTTNSAGSVALIIAGAAFILTAVWRHLPSTIKAGGFEMIWTAYNAGRRQVVNDINESVEKGEDVKIELARLEHETENRRIELQHQIDLLKLMAERGYLDYVDDGAIRSLIERLQDPPKQ